MQGESCCQALAGRQWKSRFVVAAEFRRVIRFIRLLPHVVVTALRIEFALRRRSLDRVLRETVGAEQRHRLSAAIPAATIERAIRWVYRVLPFEWTCLKHALIFGHIRRNQGLAAELRIGVQKSGGVFGAHAWVEDGAGNMLTDPLEGFSAIPLPREPYRDERASD